MNGKKRRYIVDFMIPKLNILIELKANHVWHKNQIKNGMWGAKMSRIEELIKKKEYNSYELIYQNNFNNILKNILTAYNKI